MNRIYVRDPDGPTLIRQAPRGRMVLAALLVLLSLTVSACADESSGDAGSASGEEPAGTAVEAVTPEEVLSDEELAKGAPEQREWTASAAEDYTPATAELFVSSDSSTGAIPAVKPFNFGRDPGGPEDKTLSLTVPEIGLSDVPVYNSLDEEELTESAVHVPATGFPWQDGANTFIAGHRIGYEGTGSYRIFYDLPKLEKDDEITVEDSAGGEYVYRVNLKEVVGPGTWR